MQIPSGNIEATHGKERSRIPLWSKVESEFLVESLLRLLGLWTLMQLKVCHGSCSSFLRVVRKNEGVIRSNTKESWTSGHLGATNICGNPLESHKRHAVQN